MFIDNSNVSVKKTPKIEEIASMAASLNPKFCKSSKVWISYNSTLNGTEPGWFPEFRVTVPIPLDDSTHSTKLLW